MEPRMTLITLGVADLERAVQFYCVGLGWRRSSVGGDEVAFLHTQGVVLALYPRTSLAADLGIESIGTRGGNVTFAQNVRTAEEVDRALTEAVGAGATLIKPGEHTSWGGYVGYFADPDGHVWEVAWNPGFPMSGDGSLLLPD